MLKGRGCRQYIENERGWTDPRGNHPSIRVELAGPIRVMGVDMC